MIILSNKNILINIVKENGVKGIVNLGLFAIEKWKKPDKVGYLPPSITFEVTTFCNLKCKMCANPSLKERGHFNPEDFKKFVDSNTYIKKINFTGLGETLMNPRLLEMVKYAKQKGIYSWFVNNMTLMKKEIGQKLLDSKIDLICVSVDGATKETFENIRIGAKFEDIMSNIKNFMKLKNNNSSTKVGINMVVTKENYKEINDLVKLAHELKVDNLTFKTAYLRSDNMKELSFNTVSKEDLEVELKKAKATAKKLGVNVLTWPIIKKPSKHYCPMPWENPYISYNGDVFPCCFVLQDTNGRTREENIMGNIHKEDFKKIWNGEKYKSFRRRVKTNSPPRDCLNCPNYYGLW